MQQHNILTFIYLLYMQHVLAINFGLHQAILRQYKKVPDKANEEASPCTVLFKPELITFTLGVIQY